MKIVLKSGKELEVTFEEWQELKEVFATPTYVYPVQPYCPPCNPYPVYPQYPVWPYGKHEVTCGTGGSCTHSNGTLS